MLLKVLRVRVKKTNPKPKRTRLDERCEVDPDIRYFASGLSYQFPRWRVSLTNQFGAGKEVVNGRTLQKEVDSFVTEVDYFF